MSVCPRRSGEGESCGVKQGVEGKALNLASRSHVAHWRVFPQVLEMRKGMFSGHAWVPQMAGEGGVCFVVACPLAEPFHH